MTRIAISLEDAMRDACREAGVKAPDRWAPGVFVRVPVDGKAASNRSGAVRVWPDRMGGHVVNWTTGQTVLFRACGDMAAGAAQRSRPDPEIERQRERERAAVADTCERIVRACEAAQHPYLARKGFPEERGLVIDRDALARLLTEPQRRALPEGDGPLLVIPGRVGRRLTTVQFIPADGPKKNIRGGAMSGACHRIASGRETWVCEGIATALSVRAALRLLGRSATVLSAFSAGNVAEVARGISGAVIAADHDKPLPQLGGLGTGEFFARAADRAFVMPPALGDWNDQHQAHGLRSVALAFREVAPP